MKKHLLFSLLLLIPLVALAGGYQHYNPPKVLICHVPPGNPENSFSILVDENGWNGHGNHEGDFLITENQPCPPIPPIVTPPPPPPSPPPSPPPPAPIAPPAPAPSPAPNDGGGSGPAGPTVTIYAPTPTPPAPTPTPTPAPQPAPLGVATEPVCTPLTNFFVDSGIIGDSKVYVGWQGGEGLLKFGFTEDDLAYSVTATNGIELKGLATAHYWFQVSNGCSASALIDPLP